VKEDWGHSSNLVAAELAQQAGVEHLVLIQHEPLHDDRMPDRNLEETRRYAENSRPGHKMAITSAYDGLEISV
jgi:ribonuclease BN (tRNA processing enzyme)